MKIDMGNLENKLVITAMARMLDQGMTLGEVYLRLEEIKRDTFIGMMAIENENKEKAK